MPAILPHVITKRNESNSTDTAGRNRIWPARKSAIGTTEDRSNERRKKARFEKQRERANQLDSSGKIG